MAVQEIHFGSYYGSFYRKIQLFMREVFKKFDLNFVDGIILIFVCENPGVIQDHIVYKLSLDKAAVARSLKLLENLGLLTRNIDTNNQRTKLVYPTKEAIPYKEYFDMALTAWNKVLMQDMSEPEREMLVLSMSKMRDASISIDIEQVLSSIEN